MKWSRLGIAQANPRPEQAASALRMLDAAQYLADHIHEALVLWISFGYSDPGAGFRPRRITDEALQSI